MPPVTTPPSDDPDTGGPSGSARPGHTSPPSATVASRRMYDVKTRKGTSAMANVEATNTSSGGRPNSQTLLCRSYAKLRKDRIVTLSRR